MPEAQLHVQLREKTGQQDAKKLRKTGKIPAVFYARNEATLPLAVDVKEFQNVFHREVNILDVIFPDGKLRKSILRGVQVDPVSDAFLHIDLMGISLTEKLRMKIPVVLKGTPVGVKNGGVLEHLLREVEVEGLPLDFPEHIEIEVSHLDIGNTISLEHIQADKFRFITDVHQPLANVVQPKVIKAETPVAEAAPAEGEEGEEVKVAGEEVKEGKEAKETKETKAPKATKEPKEPKK